MSLHTKGVDACTSSADACEAFAHMQQPNTSKKILNNALAQGSPTWCPRAPGRPQGPCWSPAGQFLKIGLR